MAEGAQDIARFFDRRACCPPRPGRAREGTARAPRGVSATLLRLLDRAGLAGRSVLDAGCGQGTLAIALSRRGARVRGVDLSAASIAAARRAAQGAGADVDLTVGDAATDRLEPHDVVVLDKVVCCYFDAGALLANAAPAARAALALSLPHSRGPRGVLARALLAAENGWRRVRRDPFRAFVHDVDGVVAALARHGLYPAVQRDRWMWQAGVFERRP